MNEQTTLLYTCEGTINAYDYKKATHYFPGTYWLNVLVLSFVNLIISAVVAIATSNLITTLATFIFIQILFMIYCKVKAEDIAEKDFYNRLKKNMLSTEFHLEFYDDHFINQTPNVTTRIAYSEIKKCVETDIDFYIKTANYGIIILPKNQCPLEIITFIRTRFNDIESNLGKEIKFKSAGSITPVNTKKRRMIILFILTLFSIYGALGTYTAAVRYFNLQGWIPAVLILIWLIIPILSIIYGFKYNSAGLKCTKNIVAGFIVGFILFVYGGLSFIASVMQNTLNNYACDYSNIYEYSSIINADIPENGELQIFDLSDTNEDLYNNHIIINADYQYEDTAALSDSIKNSNTWQPCKDMDSTLQIFIPFFTYTDENTYVSIYNKTLNSYNILPDNPGDYEIYSMIYDIESKYLEIHKFTFNYVKSSASDVSEPQ